MPDQGLEELSRVKIYLLKEQATKVIRSARVSFSSQLANLGNTVSHVLKHASSPQSLKVLYTMFYKRVEFYHVCSLSKCIKTVPMML